MGSHQLKIILAVAAIVSLAGVALVVVRGGEPGDVIAAPTTVEAPESLAFDDPSDANPDLVIGDDATWVPTSTTADASEYGTDDDDTDGDDTTATSGDPTPGESTAATTGPSGTTSSQPVVTSAGTGTTEGAAGPATPSTGGTSTDPSAAAPTAPATTAVPNTAVPTTTAAPTTAAPTTVEREPTVGFSGIDVGDFTNTNANISQSGQDGSFRTVCTVSHFNFDDAIVFPGRRAATHLHMYFGNALADFSSTGNSLASSGDATCQGGPLNRSAYWVPAVLDQNGDVRPAQYMLAYYKRAGDEDVVPYPNGLEMVVGNAMAMSPQPGREQPIGAGVDYAWSCGSPITVGKHDAGRLIPDCSPGEFLTLSLIFPRCSDGRLSSSDNKSHMAYPSNYGASCPASHPIRHPQLTYNIHWNNNDTNTGDWYLSSDDHSSTGGAIMPGGTTTHADWIGAWHPDVLDIMTSGCFNADHDCKGGTISPSLRLDSPTTQGFSPSNIYDSGATPTAIPFTNFGTGSTYAN